MLWVIKCTQILPKLQTLDGLNLSVIGAVEIRLRSADMGMAHQSLNGSKVVPIIQEGSRKGVPHYVRMNPLLDQSLFGQGFDKAIDCLWCKGSLLIGSMLPQGVEYGMIRAGSITTGLQIILDGEKSLDLEGNAPESLSLPNDIDDSLVPVGLEILDLEAANFGFS